MARLSKADRHTIDQAIDRIQQLEHMVTLQHAKLDVFEKCVALAAGRQYQGGAYAMPSDNLIERLATLSAEQETGDGEQSADRSNS